MKTWFILAENISGIRINGIAMINLKIIDMNENMEIVYVNENRDRNIGHI